MVKKRQRLGYEGAMSLINHGGIPSDPEDLDFCPSRDCNTITMEWATGLPR